MRQGEPTKITGALPSGEGREAMETEDGGTPRCWGGGRMGSPRDKEVDCVTTDSKGGSEGDGEALAAGVSRVARPPGRASSSAATQPSALDAAAVPGWSAQGLREPA